MLPRRSAPERAVNFHAMRELANFQARHDLDTHVQNRSLSKAYGTLATSLACFLAGFFVLFSSSGPSTRMSAMLILVVGVFFLFTGLNAAKSIFLVRQSRRPGLRAMLAEVEAEIAAVEAEAEPSPVAAD